MGVGWSCLTAPANAAGYTASMSALRDPLVYEFETVEAETSYDAWLRAKVAASLADTRPSIPHDQVMADMDLLIDQIQAKHRSV